ncbi:MAG: serine hydrolase, partial [Planctomycetota bacterium]
GIIQRAYAGTPIEGWMPWEIQEDDARALEHKRGLDESAERRSTNAGETEEKALAAFEKELAEYNALVDAGETMKNALRPLSPPIITKPANLGHQYPAHMFNAMIHPVQPYGIRGIIWYQGERNAKNAPQAFHYRKQLAKLIRFYRMSWHELSGGNVADDFPFQFTQLPSWNPPQTKPVEGLEASWAVSRDAMRLVGHDVFNSGMVVSIDTGDAVELHPKNKKPIGIRHALLALERTYGKDVVGGGPRVRRHGVKGGKMVIEFDSTGGGLMAARQGEELDAFAIAGADRQWHWAEARIEGDSVLVSSGKAPRPVAVRYAWAMNPSQRNLLYNREGLPASPFRTDDWPLFDPDAELVEVNKPKKPDGYVAVDWHRPVMIAVPEASPARETAAGKTRPAAPPPKKQHRAAPTVADGLAPEVTDLNAKDVSFALEAKLPDLEEPYVNLRPNDRNDGIPVGAFTREVGDRRAILKFTREIAAGQHGEIDSFLLMKDGKLLVESYYRRGRANYPHYQMSITKSYTAMALGRAIQLGHLTMADLDKPVLGFLEDVDRAKLVDGAAAITLAEAMNMHSGIRIGKDTARELMKTPALLKGQGQIQAYLEHSAPIPGAPREYKYQGSDPSITMQVVEAVVPGTARDFIETELLAKMGITNFAWQDDVSGLPKSAAGSSMRSRDMLKWGMVVM